MWMRPFRRCPATLQSDLVAEFVALSLRGDFVLDHLSQDAHGAFLDVLGRLVVTRGTRLRRSPAVLGLFEVLDVLLDRTPSAGVAGTLLAYSRDSQAPEIELARRAARSRCRLPVLLDGSSRRRAAGRVRGVSPATWQQADSQFVTGFPLGNGIY
jgi:hypothetical protein